MSIMAIRITTAEASWKTFPERLEDQGISWRIYQNEISLPTGLKGERDAWLTNFTDNPLEWFTQYRVRFSAAYQAFIPQLEKRDRLRSGRIGSIARASLGQGRKEDRQETQGTRKVRGDKEKWSPENFAKLSPREANFHQKAFSDK